MKAGSGTCTTYSPHVDSHTDRHWHRISAGGRKELLPASAKKRGLECSRCGLLDKGNRKAWPGLEGLGSESACVFLGENRRTTERSSVASSNALVKK